MAWDKWVIDGSVTGCPFCFCPLDGDQIVTGFSVLAAEPPHGGELVGVVHADGDEAANEFYERHKTEIDAVRERTRRHGADQ